MFLSTLAIGQPSSEEDNPELSQSVDSEEASPQNPAPVSDPPKPDRPQQESPKKVATQTTKKRKKLKAQVAVVKVEGAAVYQYNNFDSPVLEYLRAGSKVIASLKPKTGIGGFGAFYRVRLPNKKLGWMADVDLLAQFKADTRQKSKQEVNPEFEEMKEQAKMANREPIYFEKYLGAGLGIVQFTEKFDGGELSSDVTMFGFRSMGPGLLFDGPPVDFSLMFSIEAPDYYTKFANGPATGFFVISDILIPFPVIEGRSGMITLGLGPMITYTNFQVAVRNSNFDSQEVRIGLVANLGYMHRISNFAIRFDAKYYYERTDYLGAHLSFLFFKK